MSSSESTHSSLNRSGNLPLVTVVIPAFRIAQYLPEALDSVFRQTYPNYEVIVVDQDSDGSTQRALQPYRDRVTRLTLSPPSVTAARNLAIRNARGEIFANLDGDDKWADSALDVLVGMLISDPQLDCAVGSLRRFGGDASINGTTRGLVPFSPPINYRRVASREIAVSAQVVCRCSAFHRVGGYDESLRYGEDFDFALRLLLAGIRIEKSPEVVYHHRVRSDSSTAGPPIPQLKDLLYIHCKHLLLPGLGAAERQIHRNVIKRLNADIEIINGKMAVLRGDMSEAARCFRHAVRLRPSWKTASAAAGVTFLPNLVGPGLQKRIASADPGLLSSK